MPPDPPAQPIRIMKRSQIKPAHDGRSAEATRKELIRREMRFVLQQDVRRFTKQLLARLLDEGCNLHPELARNMFYGRFEHRLASDLPANTHAKRYTEARTTNTARTHPQYYAAAKYFLAHLADAETRMTAAVLDVIEHLKQEWQQMAQRCLPDTAQHGPALKNLIAQISAVNPEGHLTQHGFDTIQRRLRIAIVTSLMRYVRRPDELREKYGSVPQILQAMGRDPSLFPDLMMAFKAQIPYVRHVIAQSFWRTLNNMDTETPHELA